MSVREFIAESNNIEGIHRVTNEEIDETERFLALPKLTVEDVSSLVSVYAPHAKLRISPGMNVIVGEHVPPYGGPQILIRLDALLEAISSHSYSPYEGHIRYETLHPFMDGNGRSGRAIWLWQMGKAPLGFLHHFYYQALQGARP